MNPDKNLFFCPSCGAEMKHSDDSLFCPHCDRREQICAVNSDSEDFDFIAAETAATWIEAAAVERCSDCGGETVRIAGENSALCAHCAGSSLTTADKPYGVRPSHVAPFRLSADQAASHVSGWLKKRFMAPFSFLKELTPGALQGIYLPYWSYSANADAEYAGQAGSYYQDTEINTSSSSGGRTEAKSRRVRRVRWRMVSGSYNKIFGDVIFGDTSRTDVSILKSIEPYKLSELVRYDDKYLSGFSVERYKLGLQGNWERAKAYMGSVLRGDITAIVKRGSDVTGAVNICTKYTDISYRLMLLPLWKSTYRYGNKNYHVYLNGQTGEIHGESPVSVMKIAIAALAALAGAALLIWLL